MHPLITASYWFSILPPALSEGGLYVLVGFFGLMLVAAVVLKIVSKRKKGSLAWAKGVPKLVSLFGWMGVLGLLIVWMSYEQVRFFGSRFWFLVWGVIVALWLGRVLKYLIAEVPEKAAEYAERERIEKYLPKKK